MVFPIHVTTMSYKPLTRQVEMKGRTAPYGNLGCHDSPVDKSACVGRLGKIVSNNVPRHTSVHTAIGSTAVLPR